MRFLGLGLAVVVLCSGCALDYAKDTAPPADQIPLMVFKNLRETGVKDGKISYTMETAGSESYPSRKQVQLKQFRFQEYDSSGGRASDGQADSAVIDTATNDAKISGQLRARSEEQGVTLVIGRTGGGGGLTWANDDRILRTLPGTPVTLTKDDGSNIQAQSLTLDLGTKRLELGEGVEGTWTPEEHHRATPLVSPSHAGVSTVR